MSIVFPNSEISLGGLHSRSGLDETLELGGAITLLLASSSREPLWRVMVPVEGERLWVGSPASVFLSANLIGDTIDLLNPLPCGGRAICNSL